MNTRDMLELLWNIYPLGKFRINFVENGSKIALSLSKKPFKDELSPVKPIRVIYGSTSVFAMSSIDVALEFIEHRGFSKHKIHLSVRRLLEDILNYYKEVNNIIDNSLSKEFLDEAIAASERRVDAIANKLEEAIRDGSSFDVEKLLHDMDNEPKPKLTLVKDKFKPKGD